MLWWVEGCLGEVVVVVVLPLGVEGVYLIARVREAERIIAN